MEIIGLILSLGLGLLLAIGAGWFTDSIIVGIIAFIIGAGYLYGQWIQAGVPYDIHDIKKKLDDADEE